MCCKRSYFVNNVYLCVVMNSHTHDFKPIYKHLISVFDITILNSFCIFIAYLFLHEINWLWGLLAINFILIVALRQWFMHCLEIHWLESILNKVLKRITDIVVALLFIFTLLPILIIIGTIILKRQKTGPVLTFREICPNVDKKNFEGLVFNDCEQLEKFNLRYAPMAFNLLLGQISLWDLKAFTEIIPETEEQESIFEGSEDESQDENAISTPLEPLPDTREDQEELENAIWDEKSSEENFKADNPENADDLCEEATEEIEKKSNDTLTNHQE